MRIVALRTITEKIGSGSTPRGGEDSYARHGTPLIRSLNVYDDGFREEGLAFLTAQQANDLSNVTVESGDVLLNITGASVARCCLAPDRLLPARVNQHVCIIRPTKAVLDSHYLQHLLISGPTKKRLLRIGESGGATRQAITKADLQNLEIPLPALQDQKRIAAVLGAADNLRAKRRESIGQLDSLVKATFLEMFGDPVTNPNGWGQSVLQDTGTHSKVGPFGSLLHKADYITGGVPLVNPKHIRHGTIEHGGDETVSESKAEELSGYRLKSGDVLMGRRGEMGRCTVIQPTQEKWLCGTGSVLLRPDKRTITSLYLCSLLSSQSMRKHLEHLSGGAIMPSLSGTQIQSLLIPLPPLDLQNRFASIVESIERQMARLKAHLSELDKLFASLQSRAFSGELCSPSFPRPHASA